MDTIDVTIHHSIEFTGAAAWTLIACLVLLTLTAFCLLYPMLMPPPALPSDPPKGKLGFV